MAQACPRPISLLQPHRQWCLETSWLNSPAPCGLLEQQGPGREDQTRCLGMCAGKHLAVSALWLWALLLMSAFCTARRCHFSSSKLSSNGQGQWESRMHTMRGKNIHTGRHVVALPWLSSLCTDGLLAVNLVRTLPDFASRWAGARRCPDRWRPAALPCSLDAWRSKAESCPTGSQHTGLICGPSARRQPLGAPFAVQEPWTSSTGAGGLGHKRRETITFSL